METAYILYFYMSVCLFACDKYFIQKVLRLHSWNLLARYFILVESVEQCIYNFILLYLALSHWKWRILTSILAIRGECLFLFVLLLRNLRKYDITTVNYYIFSTLVYHERINYPLFIADHQAFMICRIHKEK